MLGDPGLGQRTAALHRSQRVAAPELLLRRHRRLQLLARDHPLGQVVQPLEAVAAGDHHLACGEQVLEDPLLRLPVPHAAASAAPLEVPGRQRAVGSQRVEHALLHLRVVVVLPAPPVLLAEVLHAPLEERIVLDRDEAGLVRPVLEDAAALQQPRDGRLRVARRCVIRASAGAPGRRSRSSRAGRSRGGGSSRRRRRPARGGTGSRSPGARRRSGGAVRPRQSPRRRLRLERDVARTAATRSIHAWTSGTARGRSRPPAPGACTRRARCRRS